MLKTIVPQLVFQIVSDGMANDSVTIDTMLNYAQIAEWRILMSLCICHAWDSHEDPEISRNIFVIVSVSFT